MNEQREREGFVERENSLEEIKEKVRVVGGAKRTSGLSELE